jgi:uncharacterized protein (TIGR02246 family)
MARKLVLATTLIWSQLAYSADATTEKGVLKVFDTLTEAWRNADGETWGEQFADDADFTVWFGLELKGREAIAAGHQYIYDGVYADTVFEFDVAQVRQLITDAVVVHLKGFVVSDGEQRPEKPDAVPVAVMQRIDDSWKLVTFHNTANIVDEIGESISLEEFKKLVAEATARK